MDLGKITITKNKDCDNNTYYTAYMYGIDNVVGGGNTRNEARDELLKNIVVYINYLEEDCLGTKDKLYKRLDQMNILTNKWNKLKEWVNEFHRDVVAVYPNTLLTKMQELDKGE